MRHDTVTRTQQPCFLAVVSKYKQRVRRHSVHCRLIIRVPCLNVSGHCLVLRANLLLTARKRLLAGRESDITAGQTGRRSTDAVSETVQYRSLHFAVWLICPIHKINGSPANDILERKYRMKSRNCSLMSPDTTAAVGTVW